MKVTILVVLALAIGVARADPKQEARKHVETADVQYKLGQFDEALAEYSAAYQLYPVPALLFNIGQCHRNLKHYEQAVFFYRGFLRDSPPDAPNRALVEDLIRETETDLDRQKAEAETARKAAADAEQQRRDEEAARQRIAEEQRIAAARQQVQVVPAETPIYRKWWFWGAVGGAALAVGGSVYLATSSTKLIEPMGTLGGLDRR